MTNLKDILINDEITAFNKAGRDNSIKLNKIADILGIELINYFEDSTRRDYYEHYIYFEDFLNALKDEQRCKIMRQKLRLMAFL